MKTIHVVRPSVSYTDYCILYRKEKGSCHKALNLLTFCRKMRDGKKVKIGDYTFLGC